MLHGGAGGAGKDRKDRKRLYMARRKEHFDAYPMRTYVRFPPAAITSITGHHQPSPSLTTPHHPNTKLSPTHYHPVTTSLPTTTNPPPRVVHTGTMTSVPAVTSAR